MVEISSGICFPEEKRRQLKIKKNKIDDYANVIPSRTGATSFSYVAIGINTVPGILRTFTKSVSP